MALSAAVFSAPLAEDPKKSGGKIRWTESIQYGDYRAVHSPDAKYRLPYKDGEAHRITQAYGDPLTSHIGHHHQHAVDFAMAEGYSSPRSGLLSRQRHCLRKSLRQRKSARTRLSITARPACSRPRSCSSPGHSRW